MEDSTRETLAVALVATMLAIMCFDPQLGVSGDNCEFIVLARSLWSGQGLSYINMVEPVTASKYPPGFITMLAPLSDSIFAMKHLVVAMFVALAVMVARVHGFWAGIAIAANPLLLDYSSQIMSEVPYTTLSVAALLVLPRNFAFGLGLAVLASLTRSVGLVLLVAVILTETGRRRMWAIAMTVVTTGGWSLRGKLVGEPDQLGYFEQLLRANAYYPEHGWIEPAQMLGRIMLHMDFYWPYVAPFLLVPLVDRNWRRVLYVAGVVGTTIVWPWQDVRFLLPIVPVLIISLSQYKRVATVLAPLAVIFGLLNAPGPLEYPRGWSHYRDASYWIGRNTPSDAVIVCRKQFWTYVVSGRKTLLYEFSGPDEVLQGIRAGGGTHILVDNMGYGSTPKHLIPALNQSPEEFKILWHVTHPDTWVLERQL